MKYKVLLNDGLRTQKTYDNVGSVDVVDGTLYFYQEGSDSALVGGADGWLAFELVE